MKVYKCTVARNTDGSFLCIRVTSAKVKHETYDSYILTERYEAFDNFDVVKKHTVSTCPGLAIEMFINENRALLINMDNAKKELERHIETAKSLLEDLKAKGMAYNEDAF